MERTPPPDAPTPPTHHRNGVALGLMIGSAIACTGSLVHEGLRSIWAHLLEDLPDVSFYDGEDWLAICCLIGLHLCVAASLCFRTTISQHLPIRITLTSLCMLNTIALWPAVVFDYFYGTELLGYAIASTLTTTALVMLKSPRTNSTKFDS